MAIAKQKYVIEVASEQNNSLFFGPLGKRLRGRWDSAKVVKFQVSESSSLSSLYEAAPVIPGMYIFLDLEKRTAGCFDPLSLEGRGQRIMSQIKAHFMKTDNRAVEPAEPTELTHLDADGIKDFLYSMVRAANSGAAIVPTGSPELPDLEEVKRMPGKRTLNHGFPSMNEETLRYEKPYLFEVPVGGGQKS